MKQNTRKIGRHGMSQTRIYNIHARIKQRCNNPRFFQYHLYGGRGIKMCERWNSFINFYEDMKDGYSDDLTIDRIDNDGNYEPSNCRWATYTEQANNRRNNRLLNYNGRTQSLASWARELGIPRSTVANRIYRYGWSDAKSLSTPRRKYL